MSYPIKEQITQAVVTCLQQLVVNPPLSGYITSLASVSRWQRGSLPTTNLNANVIVEGDVPVPDEESAEQSSTWMRHYSILVTADEVQGTPFEQTLNAISADIEKILVNEVKDSNFLGGIVQDVRALGTIYPIDANDVGGVEVHIGVLYRTYIYDPYQLV